MHNHLRVRDLPIKCLTKQVLDEYLEVFICEMAQVLKELMSQGEVLRHFEVLFLVEPSQRVWIDEATSRMSLKEFLPQLKGLIWRCNDFDLIFEVSDPTHCLTVLLKVDTLESIDN